MEGNLLTMSDAVANDDGYGNCAEADFDAEEDDGFGDPDLELLSEGASAELNGGSTNLACLELGAKEGNAVDGKQVSKKMPALTAAEIGSNSLKRLKQDASA